MTGKKSAAPSPESIARANRQRLAHEEGLRAMADAERDAVAVRKNMERLRACEKPKRRKRSRVTRRLSLPRPGSARSPSRNKAVPVRRRAAGMPPAPGFLPEPSANKFPRLSSDHPEPSTDGRQRASQKYAV